MDRHHRRYGQPPAVYDMNHRYPAADMQSSPYAGDLHFPNGWYDRQSRVYYRAVVADDRDPLTQLLNQPRGPVRSVDSGEPNTPPPYTYEYYDHPSSSRYIDEVPASGMYREVSRSRRPQSKRNPSQLYHSMMDLAPPRLRHTNDNLKTHVEVPSDKKVMAWLDDCDNQKSRRRSEKSSVRTEGETYYHGDVFYSHPRH